MKQLFLLSLIISISNCSFQLNLFQKLNTLTSSGLNIIISPISIYQAISLSGNGALGKTKSEIIKALNNTNITNINKENEKILKAASKMESLQIANAIFTKTTPKKTFTSKAEKFNSYIDKLTSVDQVNNWVSKKTNNKITNIINSISNIEFLIVNAVYFKNQWSHPFTKSSTKKDYFHINSSKNVSVEMMKTKTKFSYYENNEVQVVNLPYKKDSMSAIIILPKKNVNLDTYIKNLSDKKLNIIFGNLINSMVTLKLPKFKLNYSNKLNAVMQKLGMTSAFSSKLANFTEISNTKNLFIDSIMHKTYLNVDELGTEAAAVTSTSALGSSPMKLNEVEMNVNKPFLFFIRNTNLKSNFQLLFMAKIENPLK